MCLTTTELVSITMLHSFGIRTFFSPKNVRLRKGEELVFWIMHKNIEITCFSDNVCQSNIDFRAGYGTLFLKC